MNFINELNDKQYEAVTSSSKYNRIIAGAGSGKTRVLTYRLAYLLKERNIEPYRLLAITFTNKVAKEMQERTSELVEGINIHDLKISTFHSFCNYFLRREINLLDFPKSFSILDDEDKKKLIKEVVVNLGYKKSDDIVETATSLINSSKMKGLLPGDIDTRFLSDKKKLDLEVFKEYEKLKNKQFSLDFDDLLIYTVLILNKFPEVKEKYNNRFYEILVDEFQDTNDLQFELLTLLSGKESGIYVVGDPDQTIYTWRGANQRVILDIGDYFKPLNTIILNENYRSTENILKHSNVLISHNNERIKKDLFTSNKGGIEPILHKSESGDDEAKFVRNKILELVSQKGVKFKEIAILYRSSYLSREFEKEITYSKIPYKIYSGLKFYERAEIKDCLAYFKLLINPLDDISFLRIVNIPRRGFGEQALSTFKAEAKKANLSYYNYAKNIDEYISDVSPRCKKELNKLVSLLENASLKINENNESYSEILNNLITDLNYFDYLIETYKDDVDQERIANVRSLIDDIRGYLKDHPDSTFDEYLQNITLMTNQDEIDNNGNYVSLMTTHVAKGLEFNYIFVVGFNQGVFPNARAIQDRGNEGLEEERRLAYVAFTRAKKELYVTYNNGWSYTSKSTLTPSQFINEAELNLPKPLYESKFNERKYSFDTGKGFSFNKNVTPKPNNVTTFDISKKIEWKVGDTCNHDAFGEGKIIEVDGNLVKVDFKNFGIKKMQGNHPKMKKKE